MMPPFRPGATDLDVFRANVRAWFAQNVPPGWRDRMTGADAAAVEEFQRSWLARLREAGIAAPHWPQEWGGGFSAAEQVVLFQEMARSDAPRLEIFYGALYHAAATLLRAGTADQQRRHLPAILAGTAWCQGFSEPGAGSDLASLRTRAVRDGDAYVVTGQKIWSTLAQHADWCLLLVRTDPQAPKRKGITYLLLELATEGVEIRPIREMTNGVHFNEIYLDDVRVPVENRVGAENGGWQVTQATLAAERGLTMVEHAERMGIAFDGLVALVETATQAQPDVRGERLATLAQIGAEIEVLQELVATAVRRILADEAAGPESSLIKIYFSELMRRFAAFGLDLLGPDALVLQPQTYGSGLQSGNWMFDYLRSWGWTISAGTNEILRTVIAERILGLPREPSAR